MFYKKYLICFFYLTIHPIIQIPLSVGDFLDKYSILNIKAKKILDIEKQKNIFNELLLLKERYQEIITVPGVQELYEVLTCINQELWNIESEKRICEKQGIEKIICKIKNNETLLQDESHLLITFLSLARQVYIQNDQRARIKKTINIISNSEIIEEKSHF